MKKIKKFQLVEIHWIDSLSVKGWHYEDDVVDLTLPRFLLHSTVGYFLRKDKHEIVVAQSKSADGDEKCNVGELFCIPVKAIKRIKKLV